MQMSHFFGLNNILEIHRVKDLKAKERTYLHGEFYFAYTNENFDFTLRFVLLVSQTQLTFKATLVTQGGHLTFTRNWKDLQPLLR